jgi:hypothetical protein
MTVKATRHSKTPAQRAQETVDVLQRRLDRVRAAKDGLETQVRVLVTEERIVAKRLDYAKASPDLPGSDLPAGRLPGPRPTSSP